MTTTSTHIARFQSATEMAAVPDRSIALVVTSPPYPMIAMWDAVFSDQSPAAARELTAEDGPAAFDAMHRSLDVVWAEVDRVVTDGGIVCINIGDAVRTLNGKFALYPNHSRILSAGMQLGWTALPAILWRKQTNAPTKFMGSGMMPPGAYVTLEHEYILVFRKGKPRKFTTETDRKRRRASAYFWEERNLWFSDIWTDLKGTGQSVMTNGTRERSAAFPFELPFRLIAMYSVLGDTILDPFLGIGTTMAAAASLGRHSIGYEIDPALEPIIASRMADLTDTANQRQHDRIATHRRFIEDRRRAEKPCGHRNTIHQFPVMTRQEQNLSIVPVTDIRQSGSGDFEVTLAENPPPEWQRAASDSDTAPAF